MQDNSGKWQTEDKLSGTELNKISAMLAIKLVGYCTVSYLRRDIRKKIEYPGICKVKR